jgi:hypothetical protein
MSFGYSVGDFIAIGQLTWLVYKACKGACSEFQELSRELSTLHTILHELDIGIGGEGEREGSGEGRRRVGGSSFPHLPC